MYFELTGIDASQNRIADLSISQFEDNGGRIVVTPKVSTGIRLEKLAENLVKDINSACSIEVMDESEATIRTSRPKVEFSIMQDKDKIVLTGNLLHILTILRNAKIISQSFFDRFFSNPEASLLISKSAEYILPEHRIDDEDDEVKYESDPVPQQDILIEIQNVLDKLETLDADKKKEAITLLAQGIARHTSPEERSEISEISLFRLKRK